jgi:hypothetical protein
MLRVLGILKCSAYVQTFSSEISDLVGWVSEIHSGMYPHLVRNSTSPHPSYSFFVFCFAYLLVGFSALLAIQRSVQKLCRRPLHQRDEQQQRHRQFRRRVGQRTARRDRLPPRASDRQQNVYSARGTYALGALRHERHVRHTLYGRHDHLSVLILFRRALLFLLFLFLFLLSVSFALAPRGVGVLPIRKYTVLHVRRLALARRQPGQLCPRGIGEPRERGVRADVACRVERLERGERS